MTTFSELNLARPVASALEKIGYDTPTPIQAQSIPAILNGRDIQGVAQTGTGKTAAFTLPILSKLAEDPKIAPKRSTRVLILSPTRELASQINESVASYSRHIDGFKHTVIFGGVPLKRQIKRVVPGNDVIVATPGRLLDLMTQKILSLEAVEYLVLDEADQMMDMGFIHALRKIIPHLPETRQTLFFSATMPKSIAQLAAQFLTNPVKVAVTPESTTAERVEQSIIFATRAEKQNLLCIKLLDPAVDRALVFTRTKHGADRLVKRLGTVGLKSIAIHGNKSQGQRTRALTAFRSGEIKFLIATDVAARGIDIRGVSHVFNYEIPNVPEQYVHRIGRTGRAGEAGIAVSFVAGDEKSYLRDIQKMLKMTLPVEPLPKDFKEQAAALKSRPALSKAEMEPPKPAGASKPRKGRKSRPAFGEDKKAKNSKHRKGPSVRQNERRGDIRTDILENDGETSPPHKPKRDKKRPAGKPTRAERKREGEASRGEGKPFKKRSSDNHKPRRASGERSGDTDTQSQPSNFKRKPRRDDNRSSDGRRDDNRGYKGRKDGNRDDKPHRSRDDNRGYKGRKDDGRDGNREDNRGYKGKGRKDDNRGSQSGESRGYKGRKDGQRDDRPRRDDTRRDRPARDENHGERPRRDDKRPTKGPSKGARGNKGPENRNRDNRNRDNRSRDDKDRDNKRGDGAGQQGGYGSPKRRSARNDNPRSGGKPRGQSDGKGRSGDKSSFKRKPRANARPNKPNPKN